jgi:cytochrome P450
LYWSSSWGVWVVARYETVREILKDPTTFSNEQRFTTLLDRLPQSVQSQIAPLRTHYSHGLIQSDPPEHTRLRRLVHDAFSPRAMVRLRPRVTLLSDELIDEFAADGTVEFMARFARLLPMSVMCEMLDVPKGDIPQLLEWDRDIANLQATPTAEVRRTLAANAAIVAIEDYFRALIRQRRVGPAKGLIWTLGTGEDSTDGLGDEEMMAICVSLLLGGYQTTRSLLGNVMLSLLDRPPLLSDVRAHPRLVADVIEETLRLEGPIQRAWRRVNRDVELDGQQLRAGDLVYLMLGVADGDPAAYPHADQYRIDRPPRHHLAFGHGIHFCVGAPLARLEASVATARLLARLPNLRRIGEVDWLPSLHQRTLARLQLAFDPISSR